MAMTLIRFPQKNKTIADILQLLIRGACVSIFSIDVPQFFLGAGSRT